MMCDEGKDGFLGGGGGADTFWTEKGAAGQISLRNTGLYAGVIVPTVM